MALFQTKLLRSLVALISKRWEQGVSLNASILEIGEYFDSILLISEIEVGVFTTQHETKL